MQKGRKGDDVQSIHTVLCTQGVRVWPLGIAIIADESELLQKTEIVMSYKNDVIIVMPHVETQVRYRVSVYVKCQKDLTHTDDKNDLQNKHEKVCDNFEPTNPIKTILMKRVMF